MRARVTNTLVLHLCGDDMALLLIVEAHDAFDGDAVGFNGVIPNGSGSKNHNPHILSRQIFPFP